MVYNPIDLKRELKEKGLIIPATFDPVFKALLTDKKCRGYLANIISMITGIPFKKLIDNITFQNSEMSVDKVNSKKEKSDLIVSIDNNIINLEMNNDKYNGLFEKNNAYQNKLISDQFLTGKSYLDVKKVIQINFDNFNMFDERSVIKFEILDKERLLVEDKNFIKYHVSLSNVEKRYYTKGELTKLEKYLLLLIMNKRCDISNISKGDDILMEAKEKLEHLSNDIDMIGLYDAEIVEKKILNTRLEDAENKGMERGLAKGMKQGIEQGSRQKQLEIAKKMLDKNIDINTIILVTNLSKEDLENISKNKL